MRSRFKIVKLFAVTYKRWGEHYTKVVDFSELRHMQESKEIIKIELIGGVQCG